MIPLDSASFTAGNEYSFSAAYKGSENENSIFYNDDAKMANMFDHMIMNGELEPLIVVTSCSPGQDPLVGICKTLRI